MQKSLDTKIARILADPSVKDFILADAKDADMAYGMAAPGKSPEHYAHEARFRSLQEFRELIRQNVKQGLIDIMLMSASTSEVLTINEKIFENSHVTPAARANDATDIFAAMGGTYLSQPSLPFRTATIDHIMCGKLTCSPEERKKGADLGLYSVTFNNNLESDLVSLNAYRDFRLEAEAKGFRHFLEVFDPNACNAPGGSCPSDIGRFVNDSIARTLAGVVGKGRPLFLKIAYHGPEAMEQLASYDRSLVVGILGGAAGTTFDAFHQLCEARKYGARAALYGRMINNAESQSVFIQHLRWIADGDINDPTAAVKSYHASLEKIGVQPYRRLSDDLISTTRAVSYGGTAVKVDGGKVDTRSAGQRSPSSNSDSTQGSRSSGVDFSKMSPAEKIAWNKARWDRVVGKI